MVFFLSINLYFFFDKRVQKVGYKIITLWYFLKYLIKKTEQQYFWHKNRISKTKTKVEFLIYLF